MIELEKEAGVGAVRRGGTAGDSGFRIGGAVEEAVVWEVTVKGRALGAGTKEGGSCSTTFAEVKCWICPSKTDYIVMSLSNDSLANSDDVI